MIDVSEKLKALRKEHGYTIQFVSDSIGIASRTYQNYEYGQREISAETLFKLADFYHVTTDYLLGRKTGEPDAVERLVSEFNMSLIEHKILDRYLTLSPETRGELMDCFQTAVRDVRAECGE